MDVNVISKLADLESKPTYPQFQAEFTAKSKICRPVSHSVRRLSPRSLPPRLPRGGGATDVRSRRRNWSCCGERVGAIISLLAAHQAGLWGRGAGLGQALAS
eukprot:3799272-Rhodomonas_salina.1